MRYERLLALVLVLSLPAMACRRAPANGTAGAAAAGAPPGTPVKIGVAIDSGTPEDEARKALVLSGLREAARALQGRVADDPDRTDFGDKVEFRLVESRLRGEDREQLLRVLAEEGCTLVCAIGQGYGEAAAKVAQDHPTLRFAVIDAVVEAGNGSPAPAPASNVCLVAFAEAEGSFLAGALAGLVVADRPGAKVGFMGGIDNAATHRYEAGFVAGAASANAALRRPGMILVQYCGRDARALEDPAMASAIAQDMYRSGAEIVYHDAGASSAGLFAVAGAQGKLAIGADLDQGYAEARRLTGGSSRETAFAIITSMEKRLDRAILLLSQELIETGTVRGGVRVLGLAKGGLGLASNEANRARLAPYAEKLETFAADVSSGGMRVPADDAQASQFLKELR